MTRSELPDNWQDLAAGYVLKNLSDDESALWETLIQQHPELTDEVATMQSAFTILADIVPQHHPPDQLLSKIQVAARIESTKGNAPASPTLNTWVPRLTSDRTVLNMRVGGAIAAGIIAVLGVQFYSLQSQLQQAHNTIALLERQLQQAQLQAQTVYPVINTLQQPGTLIYNLEGSNLATTASGRLILAHKQAVIIVVQNLPELSEGKVYRLWAALPTKSSLTYCGQFNTTAQGVIQFTPRSYQCEENPTQMIITLDAATDPTTQGGPIVMQSRT